MTIGVVLLLWLSPLRSGVLPTMSAMEPIAEKSTIVSLQDLTDDLRGRLYITERVHVTLVDHNPLVMSVETLAGRTGPFVISVDREFIQELNQPEVEAAIAHELGQPLSAMIHNAEALQLIRDSLHAFVSSVVCRAMRAAEEQTPLRASATSAALR